MDSHKSDEQPHGGKLRPLKLFELANLYEVDKRTFLGMLKKHISEIGEPYGQYYSIHQVKIIFEYLGPPDAYDR